MTEAKDWVLKDRQGNYLQEFWFDSHFGIDDVSSPFRDKALRVSLDGAKLIKKAFNAFIVQNDLKLKIYRIKKCKKKYKPNVDEFCGGSGYCYNNKCKCTCHLTSFNP